MLDTQGPAAARIAGLWWLMFGLGTVIYLIVMGYLLWGIFRRRRTEEQLSPRRERLIILVGGVAIPGVVLLVLFVYTIGVMSALSTPDEREGVKIHVTGFQWWWRVDYPDLGVTTANEVHIPVNQPVEITLTSHDVIHSFWVPQLYGKLDLVPGRINPFWIEAEEPGEYWGECAEFCGAQHARMRFLVIAEPAEQFALWVDEMQEPAQAPVDPLAQRGLEVFLDSNCIYCHKIEGTNATGDLGPDLTHVASRRTLAAGTIDNSIGNLGGWISDPHSIKPGVLMPPADLTGPDMQALIAYLTSLR